MRRIPRAVTLIATLLAALPCALSAAPAGAAESGVVMNGMGLSPAGDGYVAGLGVNWVRGFLPWSDLEQRPGHLNEGELQLIEAGIAGLPPGTKVVFDVVDSPEWASGSSNPATPPRDPADYAAFIGAMARRFGDRVAAWEVWNEEDASLWWSPGPDPGAYTTLLRAAYQAVKAANQHATVLLGGLTGNDYEFLSAMYDHGAKGSFDAVAVHTDTICDVISPYEYIRNGASGPFAHRINRWAFLGYRTVHEAMLAHGDSSPIWMTELGWSTYGGVCNAGAWAGQKAGGVSPAQQAAFLTQAYHCLAQDPYVQVGIWYGLQDTGPSDSPRGFYGLLGSDLAPKPAFQALADYAHGGDRLSEPCGNFSGPTIRLIHPGNGLRYSGTLPITVSASSAFGVHEISLYHDGQIIRNFTTKPAVSTLTGHMVWFGAFKISSGRHVLTITATDTKGSTSSTSIVIYHVGGHTAHRHAHRARRAHRRHRRHHHAHGLAGRNLARP